MILALILAERSHACTCFPIDSLSAKELKKEVEFPIIGRAVKNVNYNTEVNDMWDKSNRGYNVLFKIDSIVKGKLKTKTIVIKQFGGNCDRIFEFGKQYLIVGNKLEKFINRTPKREKTKVEIPITVTQPPPPGVYSKTAIFYDSNEDEVRYWNDLAKQQVIINTSSCSSFHINNSYTRYFLGN